MPRHDHLYVPAPKTKLVPCMVCNSMIEVGFKTRTPKRCIVCSSNAEADAIRQMAAKFGPIWEKYIIGMTAFLSQHGGGGDRGSENIPRLCQN